MADVKSIAEKLMSLSKVLGLSPGEVFAIAQFLAKEYNITLKEAKDDVLLRREIPQGTEKIFMMKDATTRLEIEQICKPKQRMYIPRTIGKPCKKKFSRRK